MVRYEGTADPSGNNEVRDGRSTTTVPKYGEMTTGLFLKKQEQNNKSIDCVQETPRLI